MSGKRRVVRSVFFLFSFNLTLTKFPILYTIFTFRTSYVIDTNPMRKLTCLLFVLNFSFTFTFGQAKINPNTVSSYFKEIKENTIKNKDLWSLDLYGPILLAEPKSRVVYANFPDSNGILKKDGEIFSGILPTNINIANTALNWGGKSWAMIMLPLPENKLERLDLLSHELFHRSQPALGFKMDNPANNHLDQKDGRVYLRLELEALRKAIMAKSKSEIDNNLTNALYLRNHRYSIYKNAKSSENSLDMNEGLAAYTGIYMSGRDNKQLNDYFENKITEFQNYPTFVRSFSYLTIPVYGILLSRSDKFWNRHIDNNTNLTDFFIKSFNLNIPDNIGVEILNQYGFSEINSEETKREEKIKQLTLEYKAKFIEKPHLEIRLEKMSVSFDPRNIMPIEGYGTVYPTLRISDNWGILTVSDGGLLGTNWDKITVSEPTLINKNKVAGNGWSIDLNNGYIVEKNSFDKNYSLKKK
jgi:hypothetical protein